MKKTISIHLGGRAFKIDEDAYQMLENYISSLKAKYATFEGGDEIIADIEARLAEMFAERLNVREVVALGDVEAVISAMGQPEEFDDEDEDGDDSEPTATGFNKQNKTTRRLFRDPDDQVFAGVMSGMSLYLGIKDPIWLRLALVVFLFMSFGTAFLLYIILMLIIPEAKTASEKLQMRGEEINIDNIEKTIKDNIDNLKAHINGDKKSKRKRGHSKLAEFGGAFISILAFIAQTGLRLIGFALILFGLGSITGLLIALIVPASIVGFEVFNILPVAFNGTGNLVLSFIAIALVAFIPLIAITLLGFKIMLRRPLGFKYLGATLSGLWTVGFILLIISIAQFSRLNNSTREIQQQIVLQDPVTGVLNINVTVDEFTGENFYGIIEVGDLRVENDTIYVKDEISLDIKRSPNNSYYIQQTNRAFGRNRDEASDNASMIIYEIGLDSTSISLPEYFKVPKDCGVRGQEIELILYVPVGGAIYLSNETIDLIDDIKNVTNMYDGNMVGHTWQMLPKGLTCADCGTDTTANTGITIQSIKPITLDAFNEVNLEGAIDFELISSPNYSIEIDENWSAANSYEMHNVNGSLTIETKRGFWSGNKKRLKVKIYTPELSSIDLTGSVSGSISNLDVANLSMEASGGSNCTIEGKINAFTLEVNGASSIVLMGTSNYLDLELNGASEILAFEFQVADADVEIRGASAAELKVSGNLNAEIYGASELIYDGTPKISSETYGASSIKPRN